MNLTIRRERSADLPLIEAITACAFRDAPHSHHAEQHIVNALRRAGALTISLVAEAEASLVGHVAISPVSISDGAAGWFGLGPVSVLPQYQRRGVGSRLTHDALQMLRERAASGCVVLGEPDYYGRFGFRAHPNLALAGVPAQYFQSLSFGASRPRGIVTYHEAFDVDGPGLTRT